MIDIGVEGEEPKVVLWPGGSLAHLGKNPHHGNLWRVVWSDSRYFMFKAHDWPSFRWLPSYRGLRCYVLERWLTPYQRAKCSPEQWVIQGHAAELGPYPTYGYYYGPCWEFDGYPTLSAIESLVNLIRKGDQFSDYERAQAVIAAQEKEDIAGINRAKDIILESLPTNITKGTFLPSAMKRAEDIPERYSAEDIAAMHHNKFKVGANKAFTV